MKRSFAILCIIVICILSAKNASAQSGNLIDKHFKVLNSHDIKKLADEYSADAQVFSPNWEGAKVGPAGVTKVYSRYLSTSPDLVYHVINVINAGNNIVIEYSWGGTMVKPEKGEPSYMDGKKYTLNACVIFVIKDGKIVKETNYFDQVAFLREVGFFDQKN